jgi:uncharacterized protein YdhG (YjbR/CyaY superfamily)
MKRSKEVDIYISDAVKEARPILRKLRSLFSSNVPEAEEKISWGVPFYWWHGPLGGYAVYSKHVTFGCGGSDIPAHIRNKLERMGYKTGKKTVQIRFDQRVPAREIRTILSLRKKALSRRGAAGI